MTRKAEMIEARERLHDMLKPGDTVYACLRNVSRSGMSRRFTLHLIRATDNSGGAPFIADITGTAATAAGFRIRDGEIVMGGCGMDMAFHTIYSLASALYYGEHDLRYADDEALEREGKRPFHCTGHRNCPANDHANEGRTGAPGANYTPGRLHSDPGYALVRGRI